MNKRKDMPSDVPYIVYEGAMARNERLVKKLIICLAICVVLMFASNGAWLWAWMQYDYSSDTVTTTQDGEGVNINTVGGGVDYVPNDYGQNETQTLKE